MASGNPEPLILKKNGEKEEFPSFRDAWLKKLRGPNDSSEKIGQNNRNKIRKAIENGTPINGYHIFYKNPPLINRAKNKTNKSKPSQNKMSKQSLSEQPKEIIQRIRDLIIQINDNCANIGKAPIFNDSRTLKIWRNIEITCTSENQFIIFSLDLYKLLYETTRSTKPNFNKKRDKRKIIYDYRLPDEFLKNGTSTKHFMDIVGTLRHMYAHLEPEYKVYINKLSFHDILKELTARRRPNVDFEKFQIEVLKLFENSMEVLLKIVENE